MRENIAILSNKVIQVGLVLIAFLVPFFFLPTTSEFYNFNKTTLLVLGSFFLFFVWGLKMVAEQRVQMTRTSLDVPLLVFLGIYIIATIFSIDPIVSMIGWHPVFFYSLPTVAALVVLYFLATSHLNSTYRQAAYIAFALSASILAFLNISYYFGHPLLSSSWAQVRFWTPAGDLDKLGSFLAISIPLTTALGLSMRQAAYKYTAYVLAALQLISVALVNILFVYITLIIAFVTVILFLPKIKLQAEEKWILGALTLLTVFIVLLVNVKGLGNPVIKPLIAGKDKSISLIKPAKLPQSAAWQTSASAITVRPIFGSGPGTFGMIFTQFKPISLNNINENNLWNVRFDLPGNGLLNLLATTGAVGILSFLLIMVVLLRALTTIATGHEATRTNVGFVFLIGTIVASIASFLLFDISALTGVAFIILAAAFFSTARDFGSNIASEVNLQLVALRSGAIRSVEVGSAPAPTISKDASSLSWAVFVPALVIFAAILFLSWTNYKAEFFYQRALVASTKNQGKDTRDNLVAAISANPYRDTYHRALLVTDLALARALNQQGKLDEQQQNTLLALVRDAIDQGRIITGYEGSGLGAFNIKRSPGTSVQNVANWESLATVYANIGGQLRQDASVHSINTYSQSIRLDPTNPRLYEALGNVYMNLGDVDNAIRNYEFAVIRKFDYASGHYSLAQAVKRKGGNPARVVNELTSTLQLLENTKQNKAARERVQKELEDAKAELKEAQKSQPAQTQAPSPLQESSPSANIGQ